MVPVEIPEVPEKVKPEPIEEAKQEKTVNKIPINYTPPPVEAIQ